MSRDDGRVIGATTVVDHGPGRWTLAILSEGYRESELPTFRTDVESFVDHLFRTPPFDELWCAINVVRIEVASTESGADDPRMCGTRACDPTATGATARTYFNARFCLDSSTGRLLGVDNGLVEEVVNAHARGAHQALVIVNSTHYGGSGGRVATFSRAPAADEIGIHEIGHSAFDLADEYGECTPAWSRYTGGEPPRVNATINTNRDTVKWRRFIAPTTAIPTTTNPSCNACGPAASPVPAGTIGAFEGGNRYNCGVYSPAFDCKMRTLGRPFCAVCQQAIRDALTHYMSSWTNTTATIRAGESQRWWLWWPGNPGLEAIGVQPMTEGVELRWSDPGVQRNADGSTTYFITVTNAGSSTAQFHFRGQAI